MRPLSLSLRSTGPLRPPLRFRRFANAARSNPPASETATDRRSRYLSEWHGRRRASYGRRRNGEVEDAYRALVAQIREALAHVAARSEFYDKPWRSYEECLARARHFKQYIEHNDGYMLFNRAGKPFSNEKELQLAFGLVWCGTDFDINREVNNGRGPVDFKASFGAGDKSLIEFKLASNTALKRNLEKQVAIYEAANQTRTSVKVIVVYTAADAAKVEKILGDLKLDDEESIVVIDPRDDNKPSASKGVGLPIRVAEEQHEITF